LPAIDGPDRPATHLFSRLRSLMCNTNINHILSELIPSAPDALGS
jgi:hypothetical protein